MRVIAVNRGERKAVKWRGKTVYTGIYKYPVTSIQLEAEDVAKDEVVDRKYHGGIDKACYLFSADAYPKFKEKYPDLEWNWGMFGENITVENLQESRIHVGAQYQIGTAIVEVSEPRQPCFKLGIRFGTQQVLKDFIAIAQCGVYVRVVRPGEVKSGDIVSLLEPGSDLTIQETFKAIYAPAEHRDVVKKALNTPKLAVSTKKDMKLFPA